MYNVRILFVILTHVSHWISYEIKYFTLSILEMFCASFNEKNRLKGS